MFRKERLKKHRGVHESDNRQLNAQGYARNRRDGSSRKFGRIHKKNTSNSCAQIHYESNTLCLKPVYEWLYVNKGNECVSFPEECL